MKPQVKKSGSYFLFSLIAAIVFGLVFNTAGCCLDLSAWAASLADTGQQAQTTTAGVSDSGQASLQTIIEETTALQTGETTAQDDLSVKIKEDFDRLMGGGIDTPELFSFLDSNISDADTATITYMVGEVIRVSEEKKFDFTDKFTKGKIQEKIYKALGENYEVDMQVLAAGADAELKPLIDETIARKYKILAVEGFFMPLVDYAAYGVYAGFIDAELNEFISIYIDESTRPAVLDAGIVIPMEDFLIRMDKAFKYLEQYPDSPRYKQVNNFNGGRLNAYLGGIDNNPVFDMDGNIYPDRLTEFQAFAIQYQDTKLGSILKSYLELLDREGYKKTAGVDDFLQKLYG
jgi:hypothetical protein